MKLQHVLASAALISAALCGSVQAAQDRANIFYYSLNDSFVNQFSVQVRESAAAWDMKLAEYDAGDDLAKQLTQVQTALSQNRNPLIVNPVDALNGEAVLRNAKRAHVPVIFFNRKPSDKVMASYDDAWYVGTDPAQAGRYQAEILIDYLAAHPEADKNGNGQIEYVLIKGEATHQDTQQRTNTFIRTMMDAGVAGEPLYTGNADWSYTKALNMMKEVLFTHKINEIEAIICNNDSMALGVLNELQAHGYNSGDTSKFIPLIGIDALPQAIEAISRNQMVGTVLNDSRSLAEICIKIAKAYCEDKPVTEDLIGLPIENRQIEIPYVKYTM